MEIDKPKGTFHSLLRMSKWVSVSERDIEFFYKHRLIDHVSSDITNAKTQKLEYKK